MFRDYLRINRDAFNEYQQLKIELASKYVNNPLDYTNGKADSVSKIIEEAKAYIAQT